MSTSDNTKSSALKVAVVGGGVCGLTCAIALGRRGISVEIFEAAAQFGEIGAGLGIGANAARVLQSIGVLDEVLVKTLEPGLTMLNFWFISGMEGHEVLYDYPFTPGDEGVGAHRAAFLDALVSFVDPNAVHFHKRAVSVGIAETNPSLSVIHFADGSTHEADVVIGADGIKSATRTVITRKPAAFSNIICYRGLIPYEAAKAAGLKHDFSTGRPAMFVGENKHIVVFPVKNGTLINVVAFVADYTVPIGSTEPPSGQAWVSPASQEELLNAYAGWGSEAVALLKCIHNPSKWYIHVVHPPLESYVKGRVVLIGDAAHGMLPHLGAGAGQGIEDGYVLAQLLAHPQTTSSNLEAVLEAYDRIRRPRAQGVWDRTYRAGKIYDGHGDHGQSAEGLAEDIGRQWDFVCCHNIDDDVEIAVGWLKEKSVFT